MSVYRVGGRSVATAATANHCAAQLWNPSSTVSIWVREIHVASTASTASNLAIQRSSARGATPTSTVTPDIDNDVDQYVAQPSVSVLELATFGTQPTILTPELERWNLPAVVGAGVMFVFGPRGQGALKVKPGQGLVVFTPIAAVLPASDITFVWEE